MSGLAPLMAAPSLWARLGLEPPPLEPGTPGDRGLFGPDSMVWHVGRERVLLAGGPAALLLQLAHPLVAAGVADHSDFRRDPLARLRATLDATLRITFGDRAQAAAAAERVRAVHGRVRGALRTPVGRYPAGTRYDAQDPDLALWVHATLVWSALEAYDRFVRPLSEDERDRYERESRPTAALFGVDPGRMPDGHAQFRAYFDRTVRHELAVGEDARSLGAAVLDPPLPLALRPLGAAITALTGDLLPPPVAAAFGLRRTRRHVTVARAAAVSFRLSAGSLPAGPRFWPHYRVAVGRVRAGPS